MMKRLLPYKVGDLDKRGRRVVQVSEEGWYRDEDGKVRDPDGYEWLANTQGNQGEASARMETDAISGQTIVVRDFKIAMKPLQLLDPQVFIAHYKPVIEQTMVETGWDYADDPKPLVFGETDDGFVHIYVKMKKKSWKNRGNAYQGMKSGQSGLYKSSALVKEGALDPVIKGQSMVDVSAQDILKK